MKACCTNEIQTIQEISDYERYLTKNLFQDKQNQEPSLYEQLNETKNFQLNAIDDDILVTLSNIIKPLYIPISFQGKIVDEKGNETNQTYQLNDLVLKEPIHKSMEQKSQEQLQEEYEQQKQKQIQQVEQQFQKMITDLKASTLEDSQHVYDKFEIEKQKLQDTISQQQQQLKILEEKQKQSEQLYKKYQEQDQTTLLRQQLEQQRLEFSQMFEAQRKEILKLQQDQAQANKENQLYKEKLQQEFQQKLEEEKQKLLQQQNNQKENQPQNYQQQLNQVKIKLEQDKQQLLQQEQKQNQLQQVQQEESQELQKQQLSIQQFQNQHSEASEQQSVQHDTAQQQSPQQLDDKVAIENKQIQQNINRADSNLCDNISYTEEQNQKIELQDQQDSQFPNEFRNCGSAIEMSMNTQAIPHSEDAFISESTMQSVQNISLQQQASMLSLLQPGQLIKYKETQSRQSLPQLSQVTQDQEQLEQQSTQSEEQQQNQQIQQKQEQQENQQINTVDNNQDTNQPNDKLPQKSIANNINSNTKQTTATLPHPAVQNKNQDNTTQNQTNMTNKNSNATTLRQLQQKLQCKVSQDQLYLSQNGKVLGIIRLKSENFDFDAQNLIIKLITIENSKIKIQCKSKQEFDTKKEMLTNVLYQVRAKEYIEINDVYDQVIIKRNQQIIRRFNFEDLQCKLEDNLLHFIKQNKIIYTVRVNDQIGLQIVQELEKRGVKNV